MMSRFDFPVKFGLLALLRYMEELGLFDKNPHRWVLGHSLAQLDPTTPKDSKAAAKGHLVYYSVYAPKTYILAWEFTCGQDVLTCSTSSALLATSLKLSGPEFFDRQTDRKIPLAFRDWINEFITCESPQLSLLDNSCLDSGSYLQANLQATK